MLMLIIDYDASTANEDADDDDDGPDASQDGREGCDSHKGSSLEQGPFLRPQTLNPKPYPYLYPDYGVCA